MKAKTIFFIKFTRLKIKIQEACKIKLHTVHGKLVGVSPLVIYTPLFKYFCQDKKIRYSPPKGKV